MSKSWLAKAESVQDLGNHLYVSKPHKDDFVEWLRHEDRWREMRNRPIPVAEPYKKFFGSGMHDSRVMSIDRNSDRLRIRLDCINADIFAIDLASVLEVEEVHRQWPVELLLHKPAYVRAARYDPTGTLRFADWTKMCSDEPQQGDQYLRDWFFEEDGRIQWIAMISSMGSYRQQFLSSEMFLMADCYEATALDVRSIAMETVFGKPGRIIWEQALADFDGLWGCQALEGFVMDRMRAHGFGAGDFVPSELS
jgi:hypothetical protein